MQVGSHEAINSLCLEPKAIVIHWAAGHRFTVTQNSGPREFWHARLARRTAYFTKLQQLLNTSKETHASAGQQ